MSGPIVRKYGFPNFEKIFGERAPQHGVEEEGSAGDPPQPVQEPAEAKKGAKPASGEKKAKKSK